MTPASTLPTVKETSILTNYFAFNSNYDDGSRTSRKETEGWSWCGWG